MEHELRTWVAGVAARHGLPPAPLSAITGRGSMNHVLVVGTGERRWVVRTPAGDEPHAYGVEQWCAERARRWGIPTPAVLATGELDGRAYAIQQFVTGTDADRMPGVWHHLGSLCRRIGQVPPDADAPAAMFMRFSRDPSAAWREHVRYNLDALVPDDQLLSLGALTSTEQARVRVVLTDLLDTSFEHGLVHGDLAPRNLLVPPGGEPVLLDWGSARFGPTPWAELVHVDQLRVAGELTWGDEVDFAAGAGIDLLDAAQRALLARHRLLQAVDLVRWAIDRRPARVSAQVDALRALLDAAAHPAD